MRKLTSLLLAFLIIPGLVAAEPVVDKATVTAISEEILQAVKNGDVSVIEKYVYPGQMEIAYEEFMALTAMALPMMQDADIHNEILSISVDESSNQATIEEKTTAEVEMMGMRLRDVSISTTTYGVVDGRIRVISSEDQLISSGPVE